MGDACHRRLHFGRMYRMRSGRPRRLAPHATVFEGGGGGLGNFRGMYARTVVFYRCLRWSQNLTSASLAVYVVSHVETINDRHRIMFLSPEYEERLGEQAYRQILSSSRLLPPSHPVRDTVLLL